MGHIHSSSDYWLNLIKACCYLFINTNILPLALILGIFDVPEILQRFMFGLQLIPGDAMNWKNVINPGNIQSAYYDIEINH